MYDEDGEFYEILSPQEEAAEMAMGHMQQARDYGQQGGYTDEEVMMAGYMAIEGGEDQAGAAALFLGAPRATTAAPRRMVRVSRAGLRQAVTRMSPAVRAFARAQARAGRLATTVPSEPGPVDISYVPLVSPVGGIAAGASFTINQTSQTIFKPKRLNVSRAIADFFLIDSFSVGNVPLSAAAGAVPAASFATDATGANVRKVTANPGVQIVLQVTNIDGATHRFLSTLFGWSSQPEGGC